MTDLVVDYALLGRTESSLRGLISEFSDIRTSEHASFGGWGSAGIAAAMGGFAGNWDDHRRKLQGSMEALGTLVSQCRSGFAGTDTSLAGGLTGGTSGEHPKG
jgi:hypothetical protein